MRGEVKRFKKVSKLEAYRSDGSPKTSSSSLLLPLLTLSLSLSLPLPLARFRLKKGKHGRMKRETIQLRGRTSKAATRNEFFREVARARGGWTGTAGPYEDIVSCVTRLLRLKVI